MTENLDELNKETHEAWEVNAETWDNRMGDDGNDFFNMLCWPALASLLDPKPDSHILDIACGNGLTTRKLADLGANVTSFDFSSKLIEFATKRTADYASRITYHVMDATNESQLLSLGENKFDSALSNMALFDMANIETLFQILPKLLKPKGTFVFSLTHPAFNNASAMHVAEEMDDGEIKDIYSIKISRYMTPSYQRGLALRNQPKPQVYFDRPIQYYFNLGFQNGFVVDGFEERAFPPDAPQSFPLGWGGRSSDSSSIGHKDETDLMYSIYLHIPFCKHRCAYCDFNTYAGQDDSIPAYVSALINEIEAVSKLKPNPINMHTVFFGGGTPSLLLGSQFTSIMDALRAAFTLTPDAEISIEANPGTVSPEKLSAIREAGINRISFGVQSANTEELHMLEREHTFFDVIEAVSSARKAGFDNLNLDLIYGLPEQTLQTWQNTVKRILDLHPEHISAYALTLEHGTPFGRWASKGLLPLPNPDLAAEMYEWVCDIFEQNGYIQYEISNWGLDSGQQTIEHYGLPSYACRHNLQYWRSLPYLAFGAGAHGYANGYRYSNALRIKTYIERLANYEAQIANYKFPLSPAAVNQHKQSMQDDISEYMLNNLRLVNAGVAESDFSLRFGRALLDVYPKEIDGLIRSGLLEKNDSQIYRLTKRGRLLGNQVFMQFV